MEKPRKNNYQKYISKAIELHQDKYDYSKVALEIFNDRTKVEIVCPRHGSFSQEIRVHLRGSGCTDCWMDSSNKIKKFIKKANQIYDNKYDYSLVDYKKCDICVKIICPIHGTFEKAPSTHLSGQGCPSCSRDPKKWEQKFIKKSQEIHGNKYDYSLVDYSNIKNKVIIICPIHGQFKQKPKIHVSGAECQKCSGSERMTNEYFIERSIKLHGNKYDYSKINVENVRTKITIICAVHGEFLQTPKSHLKGYGCFECNRIKAITKEEFIEKANKIHNFRYDYSKSEVKNTTTKVSIICKDHGEFKQTPVNHFITKGCVKCFGGSSLLEKKWIKSFNNENIIVGFRNLKIDGKKIKPDGFDPTTNTIYEFYGDYWHGNPRKFDPNEINTSNGITFGELYRRTIERANLIKSAGYNLVDIWEEDYREVLKHAK